jgi:two-component system, cell cycle sensor histidine kinase and response regulator CckA
VQLCRQHAGAIHVLLTDVVLPGEDGRELAARLLAGRPEVRVLYMSGYPDDVIAQHGVQATVPALLHKPFAPDALLLTIRQALGVAR